MDLSHRLDACEKMIQIFNTLQKCRKVIFSDECVINWSCWSPNIVLWYKENPYCFKELEHNPTPVMIWVEMIEIVCLDHVSLMVQLISIHIWTCCTTGLCCNWQTITLRTVPGFNGTGHWHTMHLLLGNILARISGTLDWQWVASSGQSTWLATS